MGRADRGKAPRRARQGPGADDAHVRDGASLRLAYYYPDALEPLALAQLARPTYDVFAVSDLIRSRLYPAMSAKGRKALVDAFVARHGQIARDGIRWQLFNDLDTQEADEEGWHFPKLNPLYKARECRIEVFGPPAGGRVYRGAGRPATTDLARRPAVGSH